MQAKEKPDHFPPTARTEIFGLNRQGEAGRREIHRIIMSAAYHKALKAYFLGSSFRGLGDPNEMVEGFYASRLSDPKYFNKWETRWRENKIPLRRWLMKGFEYYLDERLREEEQARKVHSLPVDAPVAAPGPSPEQVFHRAFLLERVRGVLDKVKERCRKGLSEDHWRLFYASWFEDSGSWIQTGERFNVTAERAKRMARTVLGYFEAEFRMELRREGVPEKDMEREIQDILREVRA